MSQAVLSPPPHRRARDRAPAFLLVSLVAHGVGFALLSHLEDRPATPASRPVEMVMVEVSKPPPPPPPEKEPPPPPPKPKAPPKPP
ncbi:MAG: energy transducer TonB, partial [Cystobacter sp.]